MAKIYTVSVYGNINKFQLRSEIINADIPTKESKKEINRVFHAANRRIQNVLNSGVYSPAVKAVLEKLDGYEGFSKFSTANKNWTDLKILYSQAVEFLKQPTSTATGAKQLSRNIQKELNLNDWQMEQLTKQYMYPENPTDFFDISSDYEETLNYFERAANDVSEQLENAAQRLEGENVLNNTIYNDLKDGVTTATKNAIIESFKKYGL